MNRDANTLLLALPGQTISDYSSKVQSADKPFMCRSRNRSVCDFIKNLGFRELVHLMKEAQSACFAQSSSLCMCSGASKTDPLMLKAFGGLLHGTITFSQSLRNAPEADEHVPVSIRVHKALRYKRGTLRQRHRSVNEMLRVSETFDNFVFNTFVGIPHYIERCKFKIQALMIQAVAKGPTP